MKNPRAQPGSCGHHSFHKFYVLRVDYRQRDAGYGRVLSPVDHEVDGDGRPDNLLFSREFFLERVCHFLLVLVIASDLNQGN